MINASRDVFLFIAGSIIASSLTVTILKFFKDSTNNKLTDKKLNNALSRNNKEDQEILEKEQLSRVYSFFGEDGMERIRKSFVIVVGAGGVGSHCAFHLLRSGVGKIRIIDFDQVTLSSLNRHATATRSDVGTPKVVSMKNAFSKILPGTEIDAKVELFTEEKASILLEGNPDYVIDCIDNIDTKVSLLKYCHENKITVISSMGSACKSDPTKIQITDISKTHEDGLARAVRHRLKKERISKGVSVIFSTERSDVTIAPLSDEIKDDPKQFATLPNFRVRVLPVLGPLPAIFGASMAAHVLEDLAKNK